jgi:hypothetical protein
MPWLTVKEASKKLSVSERRVLDYIHGGKFVSRVQRASSPRGAYWLIEDPLVVNVLSVGRPRKRKESKANGS